MYYIHACSQRFNNEFKIQISRQVTYIPKAKYILDTDTKKINIINYTLLKTSQYLYYLLIILYNYVYYINYLYILLIHVLLLKTFKAMHQCIIERCEYRFMV